MHQQPTRVLLWWPLGRIHVHNSTQGDIADSPEDCSSVMQSKIMLPQPTRGHPPKHVGRFLHFHFWGGQGSISLREKEWQDRRNPGLEAQWGGSVGTPLKSPHLHICCTLPALTNMAPHLLPLGLSHPTGWQRPFPSLPLTGLSKWSIRNRHFTLGEENSFFACTGKPASSHSNEREGITWIHFN